MSVRSRSLKPHDYICGRLVLVLRWDSYRSLLSIVILHDQAYIRPSMKTQALLIEWINGFSASWLCSMRLSLPSGFLLSSSRAHYDPGRTSAWVFIVILAHRYYLIYYYHLYCLSNIGGLYLVGGSYVPVPCNIYWLAGIVVLVCLYATYRFLMNNDLASVYTVPIYTVRKMVGRYQIQKFVADFTEPQNTTVERYNAVFLNTGQPSHWRTYP